MLDLRSSARVAKMMPKQGFVHHDTLTLSFPRKRESRATAPSLALDPRFRGGDKLKCGTFKATLLSLIRHGNSQPSTLRGSEHRPHLRQRVYRSGTESLRPPRLSLAQPQLRLYLPQRRSCQHRRCQPAGARVVCPLSAGRALGRQTGRQPAGLRYRRRQCRAEGAAPDGECPQQACRHIRSAAHLELRQHRRQGLEGDGTRLRATLPHQVWQHRDPVLRDLSARRQHSDRGHYVMTPRRLLPMAALLSAATVSAASQADGPSGPFVVTIPATAKDALRLVFHNADLPLPRGGSCEGVDTTGIENP